MLETNIARIIGVIASTIVGYAAEHGMNLDPATVTAIMIAVYSLVHRLISKKSNPGDAATTAVAASDKVVQATAEYKAEKVIMPLIALTLAERLSVWKVLGKYRNERLKLNWGFFRPSVKVEAILIALIGEEPT